MATSPLPPAPVDQWFAEATARWPSVEWEKRAFAKHLNNQSPAFPLDMFLAGAAGFRVETAWEAIESDLGPKARNVLSRQPSADMTPDELWSETIARLICEDATRPPLPDGRRPAYIIRYRGLVQLLNYLILIARRAAIGRKRRMKPTLSLSPASDDDAGHEVASRSATPAQNAIAGEEAAALSGAVSTAYRSLSTEQRFLIAMVYRNGMKQKEAGALLGWSEFKTCRSLAAAMQILRSAIADWAGSDFAGDLSAAWEKTVNSCWKSVQVPRDRGSKR